jgi:hypothetical protein
LDAATEDWFGVSVSISGDTVVAGALYDDDAGNESGSAYIFERNHGGDNNWGQVQKLAASDAAAGDNFGYSVAISCDTASIGAPYDNDAGEGSGSAYIFERNEGGEDNWGGVDKLTASDGAAHDQFGHSVAISCDTVSIGAPYNDDEGDSSGSAYIYERNHGGADNWGEVQKLTASDAATGDQFGYSVAVSCDAAAIGAPFNDDAGESSGSAYLFARNEGGADNWGEKQKLVASDAFAGDYFGVSVGVGTNKLVAGAYGGDGAAYVFTVHPTELEEVEDLTVEGASLTEVSWTDQGPGVHYDMAGGLISELRVDGGVDSAECVEDDVPGTEFVDSRPDPPVGDGYYYVIRAQHACTGTYGYASSGEERTPTDACQ